MAKLEDILKKKGYSEADLQGMSALLADQKFRGALEDEFGVLETEKTKFESEAGAWAKWHQEEALPKLQAALDNEQSARAEAASHLARLKAAQDQGLIKLDQQNNPPEKKDPPVGEAFDPKKFNLVTREDIAQFSNLEGDAIALAQDIAAEHAELGLGRLNFRELRTKALAAKVPVEQYWEQTFKVGEKRQERELAKAKAHEDSIRKDERSKAIAEFANPAARPGSPSRMPFIPASKDKDGKAPWDNANERAASRVARATESVLKVQ